MPSRPEPSSESANPSTDSSAERVRARLTEVREAFAAEDAYRNKLRRERLSRAPQEEEPKSRPKE